jgi:carbon monoxide dehydrogenase subunit G
MQFTNQFELSIPPEQAWPLLLDVERVVPCMPGAEIVEIIDDRTFKGRVSVRLGPVALAFLCNARFDEIDNEAMRARIKANGADAKGRGTANSEVEFRCQPCAAGSQVTIDTDLTLSGAVAQYGRGVGLIQNVASQIIAQFARNLEDAIAEGLADEGVGGAAAGDAAAGGPAGRDPADGISAGNPVAGIAVAGVPAAADAAAGGPADGPRAGADGPATLTGGMPGGAAGLHRGVGSGAGADAGNVAAATAAGGDAAYLQGYREGYTSAFGAAYQAGFAAGLAAADGGGGGRGGLQGQAVRGHGGPGSRAGTRPVKPIGGFSLIFSSLWATVRGWFTRTPQ